jgi:hypothetical protein
VANETSEVNVNQTVEGGDAPAPVQNRGAHGDQAVRSPIDKRVILALIKTVAEVNSFVINYGEFEDTLREMIEDEDEYLEVEGEFYDAVTSSYYGEPELKYIYLVRMDFDDSYYDKLVVTPVELDGRDVKFLRDVARLLDYGFYGEEDSTSWSLANEEVDKIINSLVREWSTGCREEGTPAEAVYEIAKAYGLDVQVVDEQPATVGSGGSITYSIEGVVKVSKVYWYCNDCIVHQGYNFIEKCATWVFEEEEEEEEEQGNKEEEEEWEEGEEEVEEGD